jgi:DNA-binding CsgD family transcriptional regulator/tetratricopeptide (TPR) repeat protein
MRLRVARSKCDENEQVWPGAPVIALLRSARDSLATAAQFEQITRTAEPPLLVDRIASSLEVAATSTPLLIAIDDLQWADRISRFALRTLVPRLIGLPVVWLLASRDENIAAELPDPDPIQVDHIRLPPLRTLDLVAIAWDRLGRTPEARIRDYLTASEGNPLLATQIIDSVVRSDTPEGLDDVPAAFAAAIAHRLTELTAQARGLIELLAVADRPLPMRDATALLATRHGPGHERAMSAAIESGLVVALDPGLTLRHDLVREGVYAGLAGSQARRLHQEFADYYLMVAGDPLIAASHARAAATTGDVGSALSLISAAEMLAGINATDAGELASLAFRTVRANQPEWLDLSRRCLSVLCRTQCAGEAIAVADQILARIDDANLVGEVETDAARALWLGGRLRELEARTERALRLQVRDVGVTARLRAVRALASSWTSTGDVARREAEAAVECARTAADREALVLALQAAGEAATNQGHHRSALRHFREMRSLSGAAYLAEEVTALQFLDRYAHAQALLDQARADSGDIAGSGLPALRCAQMWQDFNLGRLDDAEAGSQTLLDLAQQLGNHVHTLDAITIRVAIALMRGDIETAATHLHLADDVTDADDQVRGPGVTVMRGWYAAARGDLSSALDILRPVVDGAADARAYWPLWPCWIGLFYRLGQAAGDHEFAAAAQQRAEAATRCNPGVASFEGVSLTLRGLASQDLNVLRHAVDVLARCPRPVLRACGADAYGRALVAAGHSADGLAQLDRAWDEYHHMGAHALRAEVQRAMREAGARRTKWPTTAAAAASATGWGSLTEAEKRVATLVSAGHTNKAAASKLGVSINTVGTHLRAVFAKLDVQSRVQLANLLHEEHARLAG